MSVALVEDAVATADVVMLLAPDEILGKLYGEIEPHIRPGAALGFSHGLAIHFRTIVPRDDLDVFLVAPKGPGNGAALALQGRQGNDRALGGGAGRRAAALASWRWLMAGRSDARGPG